MQHQFPVTADATAFMPVWLDTESDGFHGKLASIGLIAGDGRTFYAVLPVFHWSSEWARVNVAPAMGPATHMDDIHLAEELAAWLRQFDAVEIIADWHRDLMHFFALLGPRPGEQLKTCAIRASLKPHLNALVRLCGGELHHALDDAKRLRIVDTMEQQKEAP